MADLDRRSRAVAAVLQQEVQAGDRVLLFLAPGPDFLVSLYGCFYAGAIAVPTYPPEPDRLARTLPRTLRTLHDAGAACVLTTPEAGQHLVPLLQGNPLTREMRMIDIRGISEAEARAWRRPDSSPDTALLLQYTSGSEGEPKGVVLTNRNLFHNLAGIVALTGMRREDRIVSWVPPSHDLGMVIGHLLPAFVGMPAVLMSPEVFVRRPIRWLEVISRYRATVSAAPNFAFDLCTRKCAPGDIESLDLSTWRLVIDGGEPVRAATINRFCEAFVRAGFRREAFWPSYGLAEACATVSGGRPEEAPVVRGVDPRELERGRVVYVEAHPPPRSVVGCGRSLPDQEIRIVDPDTVEPLAERRVGEIWVRGASVASGYWRGGEASARTFGARLGDTGPFLRTGDLGFLDGEELFITGRIKDLIIIRGRNHYPQDIESTVEAVDPLALRAGCTAAFALEVDEEERLGICCEVNLARDAEHFQADSGRLCSRIYEEVVATQGIEPYVVVLLPPRAIPKTSSGKLQRREASRRHREGWREALRVWQPSSLAAAEGAVRAPDPAPREESQGRGGTSLQEVLEFVVARVAAHAVRPEESIDADRPLAAYGFDSLRTLQLIESLETWLGRPVGRTVPWERPSLLAIAEHIAASLVRTEPRASAGVDPAPRRGPRKSPSAGGGEDIAIVGMACRFPGGESLSAYWRLLRGGIDSVAEIPSSRWDTGALYEASAPRRGRMNTRRGGVLEKIDNFDASLFHVSPREAPHVDPQQRIFLELAWAALEDAGQAPDGLAGTDTGVFVGAYQNDYLELQAGDPNQIDEFYGTGISLSIVANRVSYFLGLQGPSMVIDTGCSSSLTAVHLACQAIRAGDCSIALAGGISLMLSPGPTIYFSQVGAMAADGRCKAFSNRADGFVRSEGGGAVVLKALSHALDDRDHVYAVLRGSAINHGGHSNGLTAPNPGAQGRVIRSALAQAGVAPAKVTYLEAHGTGTALGDLIEFEAIRAELLTGRDPAQPLCLGSVKGNIGHVEAAAGIAGLIKVALMIDHRELVPHLHGNPPLPELALVPCRLLDCAEPWRSKGPRVAAVSSFGLGGANAHVVLQEPARASRRSVGEERPPVPLFLSARTPTALRESAAAMADFSEAHADYMLEIANTVLSGRAHLAHRLALLGEDGASLVRQLREFASGASTPPGYAVPSRAMIAKASHPIFVVPGDCASQPGVQAWWLWDAHPPAVDALRHLADSLPGPQRAQLESLTAIRPQESGGPSGERLAFVIAVCLFEGWTGVGISPLRLLAFGSGQIAARYLLGELTLAEAWSRLEPGAGGVSTDCLAWQLEAGRPREPPTRVDEPALQEILEDQVVVVMADSAMVPAAVLRGRPGTLVSLEGGSRLPLGEASRRLFLAGARGDWSRLLIPTASGKLGGTPTYPFARESYWTQSPHALDRYYGPILPPCD